MKKILFNDDLYAYIENNKKEITEFLKDCGINPTAAEIENEAADQLSDEKCEFLTALKNFDNMNKYDYILVCGSLGLWYGDKIIKAKIASLYNAVIKCACYDTNIIFHTSKKNTLEIESYHHDGVNCFKLYKVVNGKKYAITRGEILKHY